MKYRLLTCLLIICIVLSGCRTAPTDRCNETEPTSNYDWVSDNSPVPEQRVGVLRAGVNGSFVAVSPSGVYAISSPFPKFDSYIVYFDHDSDTAVKLCGRADCTHDTSDCNAYIYIGSDISYYDGYLYAVSGEGKLANECTLLRMDPDGRNRIKAFDFLEFAKANGAEFVYCDLITQGYCLFTTYHLVETEDGSLVDTRLRSYYYKLDGSMKEPELIEGKSSPLYSCGDVLLAIDKDNRYYDLDVETGSETYLGDSVGVPGWFGKEACYYYKDGAVRRLTYASQTEEILIETGLTGDYYAFCFPDCLVVASSGFLESTDDRLYIYNWDFESVGTVEVDFPHSCGLQHLLIAETASRFVLSDEPLGLPKYYIEKSELGAGNCVVHEYHYS